MKRIITICAAFLMTASLWAQSPEKMSYQAVVRDGSNNLISSTGVGVQISILQGSEFGTAVYVETQTPTSNTNGLVSLEIGEGTIVSGTFASIDWANGPYFIKTETDPTGGTNYTITGTSQLLSVPYALYAKTSGSSIPGPQGPAGLNGADGATGPMGPQGPAGLNGADGIDGLDGADGVDGLDGATGPMGPQGPAGNDGLDGATGPQGLAGNDGLDGATGPMGPQGPAGNDGLDGATGPMGPQGPAGLDGANGIDGINGLDGTNGVDGLDGATGSMGPQGLQGPAGLNGADGATGPMGPQGPAGADGIDGINGLDGADGVDGLDGATGPMGPQGPAGVDGNGFSNGSANGEMLYWNGSAWVTVATTTSEGATLQMISGVPTWMGGTPPALDVTNPTTGKIWKDRNLGATQVATSSTNVPSYGDLYQWGRGTDGHQIRTSSTTATLSSTDTPGHGDFITGGDWRSPQNDNLWQGVAGINNPCPSGYRLPTEAELEAERASWGTNNAAGAFASPLKLPMAGYRDSYGPLLEVGTYGFYQSSTVSGTNMRTLYLNGSGAGMTTYYRAYGFSVRCIKD